MKMMKNLMQVLVASMILLTSASAFGQPPFGPPPRPEAPADQPQVGEPGQRMDLGKPLHRPAPTPEMLLERFDKNDDGTISLEEAKKRLKKHFARVDTDENGQLDRQELLAMIEKQSKRQRGGREMKGGDKGAGKGKGKKKKIDPAKLMDRMDHDGDELITREEAPERMRKRFDKFDTNSDGSIDMAELKQMIEKRMKKHDPPHGGPREKRDRGTGAGPETPQTELPAVPPVLP